MALGVLSGLRMRAHIHRAVIVSSLLAIVSGCAGASPDTKGEGEIAIALAVVPADVACVQIDVTNPDRVVRNRFDVVAAQSSTTLHMSGVPIGSDSVSGKAFASLCSAVTDSSVPTWTAASVPTQVSAGAAANVALIMHRNGTLNACVDFEDPSVDAGGPPGTTGACATFQEFALDPNARPQEITAGPDGNMWFTEASAIGRITPSGVITEFPLPSAGVFPAGIAAGPDGNVWFAETGTSSIGRITPTGQITEMRIPGAACSPMGIAAGPDGNVYFTADVDQDTSVLGRVTPSGDMTEFTLPQHTEGRHIVIGPDSKLWIVAIGLAGLNAPGGGPGGLVRFDTATSAFDFFPSLQPIEGHYGVAVGADANLWFPLGDNDGLNNYLARMDTHGSITEYPIPGGGNTAFNIALGSDGNVWFPTTWTDGSVSSMARATPSGDIAQFRIPTPNADAFGVAAGPDGNVWFTEIGAGKIGYIVP